MKKYLLSNSRIMRATTGASVQRWACILAMSAPCVAVTIGTLAEYETATEAKLALALAAVLTALAIAPMVVQAAKGIEA